MAVFLAGSRRTAKCGLTRSHDNDFVGHAQRTVGILIVGKRAALPLWNVAAHGMVINRVGCDLRESISINDSKSSIESVFTVARLFSSALPKYSRHV
jgi:hypothetical protein